VSAAGAAAQVAELHTKADESPTPEPSWAVPLSDVVVDEEIERAVLDTVRSGWWSMGPQVQAFEREFSRRTGARFAFAVTNGTAALHLALLASGIGPGDEVVVPALNFVAAANSIGHTGATPVFCDIEGNDSLNADPADIERAIGEATRAVVVMHYGGHPCRMEPILELAERHGLTVIEDAAHAPGATWRERSCGTIGDVGCFSFFANKNLPVGEGGMVVTDDERLAERIALLRSHGMTTLTWDRHRGHAHSYDVVAQGFNYRLDEIRAALGLVQLGRIQQGNRARARIVAQYRAALDGVAGITMPFPPTDETRPSHHLAVILLPERTPRADFRAALAARGIQTSVHYPPIHEFAQYRVLQTRRSLPATDAVSRRVVTLPLFPHMSDSQVALVMETVLDALETESVS
jgi:dTDP-4-amino-4,6-dideoxygalactose transaminase